MELTADEARRRFGGEAVARLATVGEDGHPHLVPVTFALDGDLVVFAVDHKPKSGRQLRRIANIRRDPRVALLADHYAPDWTALWWARADGVAEVHEQDPAALRLLTAAYEQYARRPPAGPFVRIRVRRWTGWAYTDPGPDR
ncbi:TIGR03668 family PPOX class F420-dependent oxidoreductase [Actinacidiphila acididurans]|uniref:TIGR03668 family PPOX class F420-dependent oxidoreductase n=1 Tax=Actinacidiphila acididurans TaxID=2784346 RepID=A0ABS2TNG4_9ACTN|nr:TIGR03668 family PPOX class F420-dependent oxidoreductase [Actinacidiphila acididurans]MBM9504883.1 TIGR03668 family PPOX class F420-dependent oxidoreductase [Actinacidiphila acididurans]